MLVSIIIPIYNVETFVERCLLSVLNQTYKKTEIIVINDCSQDKSMDIVRGIIEGNPDKFPKVQIIEHSENKGISASRNTGINASEGDYIFFLDSDDWLSSDCIEKQVFLAKKYNSDLVIGDLNFEGYNWGFHKWWDFNCLPENIDDNVIIQNLFYSFKIYMMVWNKLIRRSIIMNNNIYFKEGIIHEDDLWFYELIRFIKKMSILNAKTYFYYLREGSLMSKNNIVNLNNKYIVSEFMIKSLNKDMQDNRCKFALLYADSVIKNNFYNNRSIEEFRSYKKEIKSNINVDRKSVV